MTADPTKLVDVLNHFYKQVKGEWVCLKTNADTLRGGGIELTFEETAPVGDIEAIDMGDQLFPHLHGGIPPSGVVHEEMEVVRAADGTFLEIVGLLGDADSKSETTIEKVEVISTPKSFPSVLRWGLVVGAAMLVGFGAARLTNVKKE